jgi:hypothetical protein
VLHDNKGLKHESNGQRTDTKRGPNSDSNFLSETFSVWKLSKDEDLMTLSCLLPGRRTLGFSTTAWVPCLQIPVLVETPGGVERHDLVGVQKKRSKNKLRHKCLRRGIKIGESKVITGDPVSPTRVFAKPGSSTDICGN